MENGDEKSTKAKYINLDNLNFRTRSNTKLILEMISLYLEQTPPLIKSLNQSCQDKNWKSLYSAVDKMIPSFSIMGISKDYEEMAKRIQALASVPPDTDEIQNLVLQIENVCEQACQELKYEYSKLTNIIL